MTNTDIKVSGMTCEHCVRSVTEELQEISGVQQVQVELVTGGDSPVHITSEAPLNDADVRNAIEEAGYSLAQ